MTTTTSVPNSLSPRRYRLGHLLGQWYTWTALAGGLLIAGGIYRSGVTNGQELPRPSEARPAPPMGASAPGSLPLIDEALSLPPIRVTTGRGKKQVVNVAFQAPTQLPDEPTPLIQLPGMNDADDPLEIPVPIPPRNFNNPVMAQPAPVQLPMAVQVPAPMPVQVPAPMPMAPQRLAPINLPVVPEIEPEADTNAQVPMKQAEPEGELIPKQPMKVNPEKKVEDFGNDTERAVLIGAARTAVNKGDLLLAVARFTEYLRRYPDDTAVRSEFAGVLIQAGRAAQALAQLERLLNDKPDDIKLRLQVGDIYVSLGEYKRALTQYQMAFERSKGDPEVAAKLARGYTFDNNVDMALQIYERYLATFRPNDPKTPRSQGLLLLDLERYGDAINYLVVQRANNPKDLDVIGGLIRAFGRLGDKERANIMINEMEKVEPQEIAIRMGLAETLYLTEEFELAGAVFQQVLRLKPGYGLAIVGVARVQNELYLTAMARQTLESFTPDPDAQRSYFLTWSEYYQRTGEYAEAKQIYLDMLRRNPSDYKVRLSLGKLYDYYLFEFERSKAEFAKIPPSSTYARAARLGFAESLYKQRRFSEALEAGRVLMIENPNDATAVAQYARHLMKAGACDRAETLCRAFLATQVKVESQGLTVRFALGRVLIEAKKYLDASRNYEILLGRPASRNATAFWGLAYTSEKLGQPDKAASAISAATNPLGGDILARIQLCDLYQDVYEDHHALDHANAILAFDPNHLPALVRVADIQVRQVRFTADSSPLFAICQTILNQSPTNIRALLGMARGFSNIQAYDKAVIQYDQLVSVEREFILPLLEKARVLQGDNKYGSSQSLYNQIQTPSPEDQLQNDLLGLAQTDPQIRPLIEPYLVAKLPCEVLKSEMTRLVTSVPDQKAQESIRRILIDYESRTANHMGYRLEQQAVNLKDWRNYDAVPAFKVANDYQPNNASTLFGEGQVFSQLKQTNNAIQSYSKLLEVNPQDRDGMVAIERANAELAPKLLMNYEYFYQNGRDGLAFINRHRGSVAGSIPLGDENEYLNIGYTQAFIEPPGAEELNGYIPFLRVQKKFWDNRLLTHAQVNIEEYSDRIDTRPTFDVGYVYDHSDGVHFRGNLFLENVLENSESIRTDIHRFGGGLGANFKPTRLWQFGADYRYAYYSDVNSLNQFDVFNEVKLSMAPKELKFITQFFYQSFSEQTNFVRPRINNTDLVGVIHPYFAPESFGYTSARVEWKQWLTRDFFAHSNQVWYSLSYGVGYDTSAVVYQDARASFNYDYCSWLSVGMSGQTLISAPYTNAVASAYVVLRFP